MVFRYASFSTSSIPKVRAFTKKAKMPLHFCGSHCSNLVAPQSRNMVFGVLDISMNPRNHENEDVSICGKVQVSS